MKYNNFQQKEETILMTFRKDEGRGNIEIVRTWKSYKVVRLCSEHNLYTLGSGADFQTMLDIVDNDMPSLSNLYTVARDIFNHSSCKYDKNDEIKNDALVNGMISVIMGYLENETVETEYYIK